MADISLLYPKGKAVSTMTLTDESINDLSVDYIVESLTKDIYEKNNIKKNRIWTYNGNFKFLDS